MTIRNPNRAKLFQNGRSQAVRLPRDFRFEGTEVRIWREGDIVMLASALPPNGDADLATAPSHHAPMSASLQSQLLEALSTLSLEVNQSPAAPNRSSALKALANLTWGEVQVGDSSKPAS